MSLFDGYSARPLPLDNRVQTGKTAGGEEQGSAPASRSVEGWRKAVECWPKEGEAVLLNFMAAVCPGCRVAPAGLRNLHEESGPEGFRHIGIALHADSPAKWRVLRRKHGPARPLGAVCRADADICLKHRPARPSLGRALVLLDHGDSIHPVDMGRKGEEPLHDAIVKPLAR
jgi:hypothetical protein